MLLILDQPPLMYYLKSLKWCVCSSTKSKDLRIVHKLRSDLRPPQRCLICATPAYIPNAGVFPPDCVQRKQSLPSTSLIDIAPETTFWLKVGQVYSPSHFWLLRSGEEYHDAMDNIMDEMNEYFKKGEGKDRVLSMCAVQGGHYCSAMFEDDWHRSVIIKIIDCDTVKVCHVDYGTVHYERASKLKPLKKRWASLPPQAIRARLARVRPVGWPHAAAAHSLRLVDKKQLVGYVEAVYHETSDPHLLPTFDALESGDTPCYEEIWQFLRNSISLQDMPEFTRHVAPPLAPESVPPLLALLLLLLASHPQMNTTYALSFKESCFCKH